MRPCWKACKVCGKKWYARTRDEIRIRSTCSEECRGALISQSKLEHRTIPRDFVLRAVQSHGTLTEAAASLNVGMSVMKRLLKDIPPEERAPRVELSEDAMSHIDGCLLSDAWIDRGSERASSLRLQTTHKEYADFIEQLWKSFGLVVYASTGEREETRPGWKVGKHLHYTVYTARYRNFALERKRWYPDGKKIVPRDLRNTPAMWRMEYVGDGNVYLRFRTALEICLATNSFSMDEVAFLQLLLRDSGFDSSTAFIRGAPVIKMYESAKYFLRWLGACPVKFFEYKWPLLEVACRCCGKMFDVLDARSIRWRQICPACESSLQAF